MPDVKQYESNESPGAATIRNIEHIDVALTIDWVDLKDPLVNRLYPFLAVLSHINRIGNQEQVPECLFGQLIESAIKLLERYPDEVISVGCMWVAAAIDEKIMISSWGKEWGQETLCSRLFLRGDSGVYCFTLLDQWLQHPTPNPSLLLVAYLCMKMGFRGQYRHGNQERLSELYVQLKNRLAKNRYLREQPFSFIEISSGSAYKSPSRLKKLPVAIVASALIVTMVVGSSVWSVTTQYRLREEIQGGAHRLNQLFDDYKPVNQADIHNALFPEK